ncbi:DUF1360 domain-containing protein, partial [Bacillus sp. JCM 19041]
MVTPFEWALLAFATCRFTRLLVWDEIMSWIRTPFIEEIESYDED